MNPNHLQSFKVKEMDKNAIIKEKMDEMLAWIEGVDEEVWGEDE